jgi:plastocyanin
MSIPSLGLSKTQVSGAVVAAIIAASVAIAAMGVLTYFRKVEPLKTWLVPYVPTAQYGGIFMYSNVIWGVLWVGLFFALRSRQNFGNLRTWLVFFLVFLGAGSVFAMASLDWSQLQTVMQLGSSESSIESADHAFEVTITILEGSSVMGNPSYGPDAVTVGMDELMIWVNADAAPHTVTSGQAGDPDAGKLFDSGSLGQGKKFSLPAKNLAAGEYNYYCTVHPFMKGRIAVQ